MAGRLPHRSNLVEPRSAPRDETVGPDLLSLVNTPQRALTPYEQILHEDVEAVLFVRIPQIPSSRAFGTYPVTSFGEYMARVPKERKDWKIVPVDPRPFPDRLRDHPVENALLSDNAVGMLAVCGLALVLTTPIVLWGKRKRAHRITER